MIKCLDTYALAEIAEGNPKFVAYLSCEFVVTDLTLTEFFGVLLREYGEPTAQYWLRKLEPYCKKTDLPTLIEAAKFRQMNRKRNISFFDAVGYVYAVRNNCLFVTGDKEFEKVPQVEFVK